MQRSRLTPMNGLRRVCEPACCSSKCNCKSCVTQTLTAVPSEVHMRSGKNRRICSQDDPLCRCVILIKAAKDDVFTLKANSGRVHRKHSNNFLGENGLCHNDTIARPRPKRGTPSVDASIAQAALVRIMCCMKAQFTKRYSSSVG